MGVTLVANLRPFGRSRNDEHSRKYRLIARLGKADLELTSSPLVSIVDRCFTRWLSSRLVGQCTLHKVTASPHLLH